MMRDERPLLRREVVLILMFSSWCCIPCADRGRYVSAAVLSYDLSTLVDPGRSTAENPIHRAMWRGRRTRQTSPRVYCVVESRWGILGDDVDGTAIGDVAVGAAHPSVVLMLRRRRRATQIDSESRQLLVPAQSCPSLPDDAQRRQLCLGRICALPNASTDFWCSALHLNCSYLLIWLYAHRPSMMSQRKA
ncbi:hypothetical protein FA95DRAFT_632404 [Auriscalpium vulgare]|uniref:Uncharacterized protein n=1 Tax=Auriscalpium vulgare TaxID=40419 RepID=A0ACB8REB5_9AGAM|nr:hypothetical protein FA95DRAFT_632404 [Auriscalpium vulgare]